MSSTYPDVAQGQTKPPTQKLSPSDSEQVVHVQPPPIDPAVWRTEIPLVVAERCQSPHLIAVWFSLRWLMAAFPKSRGFGTRIIAQRARVSHKYVTGWMNELIELGLVEIIGEEPIRNLPPRPVYTIPLHRLEAMSSSMAVDVLMKYGVKHLPTPPVTHPDQIPLSMHDTQTSGDKGEQTSDGIRDHITGDRRDHISEDMRVQASGDRRDHISEDMRVQSNGDRRDHISGDIREQNNGDRRDHISGDIREQNNGDRRDHISGDIREQRYIPTSETTSVQYGEIAHATTLGGQEQRYPTISDHTSLHYDGDNRQQTSGDKEEQTLHHINGENRTNPQNQRHMSVDIDHHTSNKGKTTPQYMSPTSVDIDHHTSDNGYKRTHNSSVDNRHHCSDDIGEHSRTNNGIASRSGVNGDHTPDDIGDQAQQSYDKKVQNSEWHEVQNSDDIGEHHACLQSRSRISMDKHGSSQHEKLNSNSNGNGMQNLANEPAERGMIPPNAELPSPRIPHASSNTSPNLSTPPGEYLLPLHPFDLWQSACPNVRPLDFAHIEALAAEHDTTTGGYGMYWIGRAILAATLGGEIRYLKMIKVVMDRWRREGSYGSDAPWEQQRKNKPKEQHHGSATARSNQQQGQNASRRSAAGTTRKPRGERRVEETYYPISDEELTGFV